VEKRAPYNEKELFQFERMRNRRSERRQERVAGSFRVGLLRLPKAVPAPAA